MTKPVPEKEVQPPHSVHGSQQAGNTRPADVHLTRQSVGPLERISMQYTTYGMRAQVAVYSLAAERGDSAKAPYVLFDAGTALAAEELIQALPWQSCDAVYLTHHHEDHTYLAHAWPQLGWQGRVHAPEPLVTLLQDPEPVPAYRQIYWGDTAPVYVSHPFSVPGEICIGNYDVQILSTGGHTPFHAAYGFTDRGTTYLISGDVYLTRTPRRVFYETNVPMWIQSLETILALPKPLTLCPAHGPVRENAHGVVQELRDYLVQLQDQVLSFVQRTCENDPYAIASSLLHARLSRQQGREHPTGGEISVACLVRGILDPVVALPASLP